MPELLLAQLDGLARRITGTADIEDRITVERAAKEIRRLRCVCDGGHLWPDDAPTDRSVPCTRCGYNPGSTGEPRNDSADV